MHVNTSTHHFLRLASVLLATDSERGGVMAGLGLGALLVLIVLLGLLALSWLLLPLLLLSIRRVMADLLQEQRYGNALLEARLQHDHVPVPSRPHSSGSRPARGVDRRYP